MTCCIYLQRVIWFLRMPTNLLRQRRSEAGTSGAKAAGGRRIAVIEAGGEQIRIEFAETPTAARIWAALPINSTAEPWGDSIHFEIPVRSGRDRTARLNARIGDICFWSEDDRVIIGFGPTPISMPNEIRLMSPCNIWAQALDDVSVLRQVRPGARILIRPLA